MKKIISCMLIMLLLCMTTNIVLTYPTMSYMDPADGLYKASNVPSNGDVAITVSGTSRSLLAAFAVYE